MIGTVLHDRWRIQSVLGRGGMGEVFLAEHVTLGRKEALKILMPVLAIDPLFVSRFRREARAVNRLRHPNIVALYDFGQLPDGRFYLTMEYAPGELLSRHLKRDAWLTVPRTLHLVGQLVSAVHHAHSRGVVHRDLKPENLMIVGPDELLKVLDFGIAKIVAPDHKESVALSGGPELWGTPAYLSPERANGIGDDPRSDLYSIGCIAYELLVGAPPFEGLASDVVYAHTATPPRPPRELRPEIPPDLDAIILRCLEKRPAQRFQSAAELFDMLRNVPGYPAPKSAARRRFARGEGSAQDAPASKVNVRGALRRLAEALLDHGLTDPRLVGGLAILRDHEQIMARLEAAQDALEYEAEALRETILVREASLRFALGELTFEASGDLVETKAQIKELEARLAEVASEGERVRVFEQSIEQIATTRRDRLGKLQACYDALEGVVNELIPHHLDDETIHELAASLALARAQRNTTQNVER